MKIASLDIGTNSILMLIAEVEYSNIFPCREYISIPQLGADLISTGKISDQSLQQAEEVISNYRKIIEDEHVDVVIANGTEVFRKAKNSAEIINKLSQALGSEIKVITPEQESFLGFTGAIPDDSDWTVVDIGGGSTELIAGNNDSIFSCTSIPIGSLTLKKQFFKNEIPQKNEIRKAKEYITEIINVLISKFSPNNLLGIGGTTTTLAQISLGLNRFVPQEIDKFIFHYNTNLIQTEKLSKMSPAEIASKFNIHIKRAEIIYAGALIFLLLQQNIGEADFFVSTKGLRYGAIKEYLKTKDF
ncbi:MAG: hypothetical protein ABFD00_02865 [Chloroherpetonaceae bacterium]